MEMRNVPPTKISVTTRNTNAARHALIGNALRSLPVTTKRRGHAHDDGVPQRPQFTTSVEALFRQYVTGPAALSSGGGMNRTHRRS